MAKEQHIEQLLENYASGTASGEQVQELTDLINSNQHDDTIRSILERMSNRTLRVDDSDPDKLEMMIQNILSSSSGIKARSLTIVRDDNKVRSLWKRVAVAASIILAIGVGSYFMFFNKGEVPRYARNDNQEDRFKNDVNPGGYKAKLTLADGREIILDSAVIGELTKQGGTVVLNKDGQLVYDAKNKTGEVLYNTLSTATGETYATVLADGSKVWLNSGSSIKYPVAFVGNERRVEITGEAYFEVKHDEQMPFIVSVNGMEVHDLGTEFNVNAYNDEAVVSTTLVNGSAKVIKGNKNQLLIPGQQVQVRNNEMSLIRDADVVAATAWKNGVFKFTDASINQLMRQMARWYDVEIIYEAQVSDRIVATIPRTVSMVNALKILEETGVVKFRIDGKKITVMR